MRQVEGALRHSATDLSDFLSCQHLSQLNARVAARRLTKPLLLGLGDEALRQRGVEHEDRIRKDFIARGWHLVAIPGDWDHLEEGAEATRGAVAEGTDVIDQGVLVGQDRFGRPDFLVRADLLRPGATGYEVVDAKLARSAKARAVLQIAFYSRLLAGVQGQDPEFMHLALGGADGLLPLKVSSYAAYERQVDRMLDAFLVDDDSATPPSIYPDPVEHCVICSWRLTCRDRRRADDDLSLVAGISKRQRVALKEDGILTLEGFASLALLPALDGVGAEALAKTHAQAAIQLRGRHSGQHEWEFVEPERDDDGALEPNRGLLELPAPSPGDLFFDIEGARYYSENYREFGLQYLFGIVDMADVGSDGQPQYNEFWAFDRDGEKRAFEQLIDFIDSRLALNPELHVYHYNHYEPTAVERLADLHETREDIVGRLMGRHGTREDEVDTLFRRGIFVDLFRAVRQGIRASVESYSIKSIEKVAGYERQVRLEEANEQLVTFEAELDTARAEEDATAREVVRGYNEDDCRATLALRDWLEARRTDLERKLGQVLDRPSPPTEEQADTDPVIAALRDALEDGLPNDATEWNDTHRARKLMADLIEWHRREDKPKWWHWFHLLKLSDEELLTERTALAGLVLDSVIGKEKKSRLVRFTFPPQEHPFKEGDSGLDRDNRSWSIWDMDDTRSTLILKIGEQRDEPYPSCLFQRNVIDTKHHRARLLELGRQVAAIGDGEWPNGPALDLLRRCLPRIGGGQELRQPGERALDAGIRIAPMLEGTCLPIQGPPGTGKTYTGARQIATLVKAGKTVGVTANSHSVISGMLQEVFAKSLEEDKIDLRIGQKRGESDRQISPAAIGQDHVYKDNARPLAALQHGDIQVLGGTPWMWVREEYKLAVDTLFIDEASQMSLANALGVCHAARNVILLGDPQQLGQPSQAAHPPGADAAALVHILTEPDGFEHSTMPEDRGLFIEQTRRMHPTITAFTSEAFYDGLLTWLGGLEHQSVLGNGTLHGAGLRFLPVVHVGRGNASPEEAEAVARLAKELLETEWRDRDQAVRPLTAEDVLIVTPFNGQIRQIELALEAEGVSGFAVGTVDKFQGKQAPVVIYSTASSTSEDAPRGMEFLYDLRRLNVATSRAQALAAVVASPQLIRVLCRTPRQMELANAICRFVELSEPSP